MLHDPRHDLPEWKRILLRAHEIIEERGWCQLALLEDDGSVCLEGAVMLASGVALLENPACHITPRGGEAEMASAMNAIRMLRQRLTSAGDVADWNDEHGRTKDEVLKLIRDTVAEVEPVA
jgi:hypothetical protein